MWSGAWLKIWSMDLKWSNDYFAVYFELTTGIAQSVDPITVQDSIKCFYQNWHYINNLQVFLDIEIMTVYHVYMALDSKLEIVRWTRYVSAQIARSTNDGPLRTAQTANRRFMQACKFFYLVLFISITGFMFYGCMFTIKNTHLVYSLGFSFKGSRCKKNHCVFFQFDKFVSADFL